MYWDIACNVALVLLVNTITEAQPTTALLTAVATLAFASQYTGALASRRVLSAVLHVVLTQWVLFWALSLYVRTLAVSHIPLAPVPTVSDPPR